MAITQNFFTGNGTNVGPFSFTFKWLKDTDIYVSVDSVLQTVDVDYTLEALNYSTKTGGQVLFTTAPDDGANIRVFRQTNNDELTATFVSGSAIRAKDLNDNSTQNLYATQENTNYSVQDAGNVTLNANYTFLGTLTGNGSTPTNPNDFVTKAYADQLQQIASSFSLGNKGAITVNTANSWAINSSTITSAMIVDGTIQNSDISASAAIDGSKINPTFATAITANGPTVAGIATLTDGGSITPNFATKNNFTVTLEGNRTLANPINAVAGQSGSIFIVQDNAGSRTLAYGSNWEFAGGTPPALSTAADAVDRLDYIVRTPTSIHAVLTKALS